MNDLASKKFAVVGCNVSARMALRALEARYPQAELKWLPAAKDASIDEAPDVAVCVPEQIDKILCDKNSIGTRDLQWHVHFNRHEHELLSDFSSEKPQRQSSLKIQLPLRRKIESLGLWNDLTPRPWTAESGVNWDWTRELPISTPERRSTSWGLFSRQSLLQDSRLDTRFRVLGLENGDEKDSIKLIYSAPFGSESFNALLWTSHGSRPRIENESGFELKSLNRIPVGRWRSWVAQVPQKSVAFLPQLSLWLDAGDAGRYFLEHGIFRSGSLYRVFRWPSPTDPSQSLLQIEALEFFAETLGSQNWARPDTLLWDFCPFLKTHPAIWAERNLDENMIYGDPYPVLHHYARGVDFWSGGAFSNISRLTEMDALWPHLNVAHKRASTP